MILLAFILAVALPNTQAAGYVHVASQGDTIIAGPANWTAQTGGGSPTATTWSPTFTVAAKNLPLFVQWTPPATGTIWINPVMGNDPYPNYSSKEIGAIQTTAAQTFTVQPAGSKTTIVVVVPALPITKKIVATKNCAGTVAWTLYDDGTFTMDAPAVTCK